jgi:hypothetical protein
MAKELEQIVRHRDEAPFGPHAREASKGEST